ncbi:MAG: ATP-binding protein [Lentisphaerota bacterium]
MKNDLFHFFPVIVITVACLLLGVIWYQSGCIEKVYLDRVEDGLLVRTKFLSYEIKRLITDKNHAFLSQFCDAVSKESNTRITIVEPDGKVLHDSSREAENMANHAKRPEVMQAMNGTPAVVTRYSTTLSQRMIYAAVSIGGADGKNYILRTAVSFKSIDEAIASAERQITLAFILVTGFVVVFSIVIVRRLARPIEQMRVSAAQIAAGNLNIKLPIPAGGSIRDLALSMNNMAEQLKFRIAQVTNEKNERDAMFASMTEGVIAVDLKGIILDINPAAYKIFDLPSDAVGLSFYGVVRNTELHAFLEQIIKEKKPIESEFTFYGVMERHIRIKGTVIRVDGDHISAVLIVLSDFTRIKKLENFRRDFIADVSHEIKTPLTALKGAVETLQEGAINEPESAAKFMDIISRHSDRLNALVRDILSLSELERKTSSEEMDFGVVKIAGPVTGAVELCKERANSKNIALKLTEPVGDFKVKGDSQLLEQAILNLIDNAIKYNLPGTKIQVGVIASGKDIFISVSDDGCGIAQEHLPRLFERFYRVDKARSRKLGGTGLGLAIVKHISQLHKGSAEVQSTVGKGSTFTIRLPVAV